MAYVRYAIDILGRNMGRAMFTYQEERYDLYEETVYTLLE